jgi:hypothetical protein
VLFAGTIRVAARRRDRAYVRVEGLTKDVLVDGQSALNRALDSDKVIIMLDLPSEWKPNDEGQKLHSAAGFQAE